ncbi:MAG: DUF2911 domain-containing protein [Cytophagales bacterium]
MKKIGLGLFFIFVIATNSAISQEYPGYRDSPIAIAQYKLNNTYIKVTYGKPFKRGRKVFGGFVPYGRVWRTGANEATEVTFTKDVYFGPKFLKAGTYSLFTIPAENSWIIILNKKLGQFGAFEYDRKQDLLRITVPIIKSAEREDFLIEFRQADKENVINMILWWDNIQVHIPIKIL